MEKPSARTRLDRRAERTRQSLGSALVALMLEKPYNTITVQNIVERANVGRSTFYARYQDKDDLLASQLGLMIEQFSQRMAARDEDDQQLLPSLDLFRHVQEFYPVYRMVSAWGHGLDRIMDSFQVFLTQTAEKRIRALTTDPQGLPVPMPVLSNYVAGVFLSLMRWWLDNKMPYPPEQMDTMFRELVTPSIDAALKLSPGSIGSSGSLMRNP